MTKQNFSKEDIEYRAYKFFEEKGLEYVDDIDELIGYCRDFAYPLVSYLRKENRKLKAELITERKLRGISIRDKIRMEDDMEQMDKDLDFLSENIDKQRRYIKELEKQIEQMKVCQNCKSEDKDYMV